LAAFLVNIMSPQLQVFAAAKQQRLDQLLDRNAEGLLSAQEKLELEGLVAEAEQLMVANSRQLAEFARLQTPQAPPTAVPVTVWVTPHPAES
jgi:hypothetical protein